MKKIFGTDGIREIFYHHPFDLNGLVNIGKTIVTGLNDEFKNNAKVIIGGDTRESTKVIVNILSSVLTFYGVDVYDAGVCPTPGIAYETVNGEFPLGIVVSASHNPYQYNGIKFFQNNGMKLNDEIELTLENIFRSNDFISRDSGKIGKVNSSSNLLLNYINYVKGLFNKNKIDAKVVIDTSNGATFDCAPKIFDDIFNEVIYFNNEPDGRNINENCGSTNINSLVSEVKKTSSDWGIAFDGDGDRVIIIDSEGFVFDGDYILSVIALYMKENNNLPNNSITVTVMSNFGMEKFLMENGVSIRRTSVGDRFVLEEMLKTGDKIGGEQSGHIILLDDSTTGDGLISAVRFFEVLSSETNIIEKVKRELIRYPQRLINVKVKKGFKEKVLKDDGVKKCLNNEENILGEKGRILLRPSGTEHLFRVMTEGSDSELIEKIALRVSKYIEKNFGENI